MMKDTKDMSERLKYFQELKYQLEKRKQFYEEQINEVGKLLESNNNEINYNQGWINFNQRAIDEHLKKAKDTCDLNIKIDQKQKAKWHQIQIKEHHQRNIDFHKKEIEELTKELDLFEAGIKRCEEQIGFLKEKIKENTI